MTGRRWSLRTKIVASVVAIFACVLLLSGLVTTVALRQALHSQLDADLRASADRQVQMVQGPGKGASDPDRDGDGPGFRPPGGGDRALTLVLREGSDGTVEVVRNQVVDEANRVTTLDQEQIDQLTQEVRTEPSTISLGEEIGDYRVLEVDVAPGGQGGSDQGGSGEGGATQGGATQGGQGSADPGGGATAGELRVITGLPLAGVVATTRQATTILIPAALLSLLAAGAGSAFLVRRNLAPLARVAATARTVSAQQLESGEVEVADRVPERDTDPTTEVGQVGLALNNLLDTMENALTVRHDSEQRVRQFVADASHELRTPLASIRGYAELSRRQQEPVPDQVGHALGRIESEALRMQGLVEDLLLLARLDAGRPLEHAPVDLTLLCLDAVADARVAGADHRWELDLPEEPLEVNGDEARLRQVLTNLLANARTHTPAGTKVVTALRPVDDGVEISVVDNGPGIPEKLQDKVFERFSRGDDSRSRAAGSTGLGMSIVAAVVRAHRGTVRIDSVPGRTAVTVRLPEAG
ncbi:sensor histidine kinase [Ornithinimicrobium sp. Y1694]|uniref:sensor histidine kinase n=1 Tax=Ornithinimicrobium sp. Y1694 TaxID=3418590 RepID=UPI003CEA7718